MKLTIAAVLMLLAGCSKDDSSAQIGALRQQVDQLRNELLDDRHVKRSTNEDNAVFWWWCGSKYCARNLQGCTLLAGADTCQAKRIAWCDAADLASAKCFKAEMDCTSSTADSFKTCLGVE